MPCFRPIKGYRSKTVNPTGKRSIVFNSKHGFVDQPVDLPCGQCIGCRLERSRQWAIRCVHEASLHDKNCFITLTYSPEHLPPDGSLDKRAFQLFMKRLRKKYGKIRFFHCGEYGDMLGRPHYHACLFGFTFPDITERLVRGSVVKYSPSLEEIWGLGYCVIGDVTFESAAYVARYVTKKVTGKAAVDHYNEIDYSTGEILRELHPEYVTMSRRPGIASDWFDKYHSEIYGYDSVVVRGREMKPPKFYDGKYEILFPSDMKRVKRDRVEAVKVHVGLDERLCVREKISEIEEKRRVRGYEENDGSGSL